LASAGGKQLDGAAALPFFLPLPKVTRSGKGMAEAGLLHSAFRANDHGKRIGD